jgi:hypothetical protein
MHPIERVNEIVSIEYHQQTFNGSRRVARSWLDVFPKDAPRVPNGAQDGILVRAMHDANATTPKIRFKVETLLWFPERDH